MEEAIDSTLGFPKLKGGKSPPTPKTPPAPPVMKVVLRLCILGSRQDHGLELNTGIVLAVMNPDSFCESEQWNDVSTMRVKFQALCKFPFLQEDKDFQDLCKQPWGLSWGKQGCGGTAASSTGSASANPCTVYSWLSSSGPCTETAEWF